MSDTNKPDPATRRSRNMAHKPEAPEPGEANDTPIVSREKRKTKASLVIELLQRPDGATLDELGTVTGWLPHTTRAALTGLRKKGHAINKRKVDDVTRYSIASAVAQ